ncbi:ABC transporter substrate-binding protein [Microbacterium amylolyticum]|uniref:Branched-chain amino acid transport system substrate-binding protein n=1 Tax=Microbacterium amylolyticum TaxID=936337 RepID=A0ABS4ZJE8_9MICO|nr:ABC transporter substrate-binding protein [Microbacterium amylolyticum]MBP2437405.1 branched-chain amino acid transport system substrate-binding protein [Microbacterium amylolyticum]
MVRSRKLASVAAVTGVAALVLAGCSTSDDAPATGDGTDTTADAEDDAADSFPELPAPKAFDPEEYTLTLGTALPQTGDLAFLGPPEEAGVAYAQHLINEYSAESGLTVDIEWGDSGDLTNRAFETEVPRLLNADVSAIIGAASSGVSLQFIDEVIGADTILFSPANTSDEFTSRADELYFRTAPSDVLQGAVHGNMIAGDGHQTLGLIVLNDSYGTGLARYVTEAFEGAGGEVVASPTFNAGDTTFNAQISEVLAEDPDAISIIAFDQTKTILPNLVDEGYPVEQMYLVDGNLADYSADFEDGLLTGMKGTYPGPTPQQVQDWVDALTAFLEDEGTDPLTDYTYGPESYDAVNLLALASLRMQSVDAHDIADALYEVSGGTGDGETCTTFADCADIIIGGGVANYNGISSNIAFDRVGDPTEGTINIYVYQDDNTYVPVS